MNKPLLILLLGKRGAGKSTIASCFEKQYNIQHYEMSDIMKEIRKEKGKEELPLRVFVSTMHKQHGLYFGVEYIQKRNYFRGNNIVISGIRNRGEIEYIIRENEKYRVELIYLESPIFVRLSRVLCRGTRESIWQFIMEELYATKWGNRQIKKCAHVIENRDTVKKIIEEIKLNILCQAMPCPQYTPDD